MTVTEDKDILTQDVGSHHDNQEAVDYNNNRFNLGGAVHILVSQKSEVHDGYVH